MTVVRNSLKQEVATFKNFLEACKSLLGAALFVVGSTAAVSTFRAEVAPPWPEGIGFLVSGVFALAIVLGFVSHRLKTSALVFSRAWWLLAASAVLVALHFVARAEYVRHHRGTYVVTGLSLKPAVQAEVDKGLYSDDAGTLLEQWGHESADKIWDRRTWPQIAVCISFIAAIAALSAALSLFLTANLIVERERQNGL